MACAFRLAGIDLDAQLTQTVNQLLTLDEIVRTPVHIEVMYLLVEGIGIGKHSVVSRLHVKTEDGTTERAHPCELVEVVQHHVERLVTAP